MQCRYTSPDGGVDVFDNIRSGHAVFVEFAAVAEDIFGDVTEVDVEFSRVVLVGFLREGVHQPKLKVFNVGGLKVGGLHFAHDTAPTALWVVEVAIGVDTVTVLGRVHIIVVRSAF